MTKPTTKVLKKVDKLPQSLIDWSEEDQNFASSFDFELRRDLLTKEAKEGLFYLRLSGISTLKWLKRELRPLLQEDKDWYKVEHSKAGLVDSRILLETGDIEEGKRNLLLALKEERKDVEGYIDENLKYMLTTYHREILFWVDSWYDFWMNMYDLNNAEPIEKKAWDFQMYFSLFCPKPPTHPYLSFSAIWPRLLTRALGVIRPQYLNYLWKDPVVRKKVLAGEPFDNDERILPYSTVYREFLRRSGLYPKAVDLDKLEIE